MAALRLRSSWLRAAKPFRRGSRLNSNVRRRKPTMPPLRLVVVDPQGHDAMVLLREAAEEASALYPELHDPALPGPTNTPTPPGGVYLVAYSGSSPLACGAIRPLEHKIAEVRRMFVTASARRRGVARLVLRELEVRALEFGYESLRLETGNRQLPAIALYEACGFIRIPPFGTYASDPTSVCFEKVLVHANSDA